MRYLITWRSVTCMEWIPSSQSLWLSRDWSKSWSSLFPALTAPKVQLGFELLKTQVRSGCNTFCAEIPSSHLPRLFTAQWCTSHPMSSFNYPWMLTTTACCFWAWELLRGILLITRSQSPLHWFWITSAKINPRAQGIYSNSSIWGPEMDGWINLKEQLANSLNVWCAWTRNWPSLHCWKL